MAGKKVAFIGLGVMGYPMAGHLTAKNFDVTVYNRTAAKARSWTKKYGGKIAKTPALAAHGRDVVCLCVGNDDDVRSVVYGDDGAFAGMKRSAVLVDHTSVSAELARELDAAAKERGLRFVDGPISGGQTGADAGALTIMCGGDASSFKKAKPVMNAYAMAVTLMGPAGAGQLTKMVNQICVAGVVQGLAEALTFANKAGPAGRTGGGHHFQGRRPVVADGQPGQDLAEGHVRRRFFPAMDAQGRGHGAGRSGPARGSP